MDQVYSWPLPFDQILRAMPTSTKPFEVLLELMNDTPSDATIQLTRIDGGQSGGPTVLLQQGESVSLILNAGATYHYWLRQMGAQARISVKTWQDTQCSAAKVFAGQYGRDCEVWPPAEDVTVTYLRNI